MYARTIKSMFEFLEDGFRESTVTIVAALAFAYEGKTKLIGGLGKKSLCAKKGTVVDQRKESSSLQEKKRLNRYEQLKGMHKHEMKTTKTYS